MGTSEIACSSLPLITPLPIAWNNISTRVIVTLSKELFTVPFTLLHTLTLYILQRVDLHLMLWMQQTVTITCHGSTRGTSSLSIMEYSLMTCALGHGCCCRSSFYHSIEETVVKVHLSFTVWLKCCLKFDGLVPLWLILMCPYRVQV